MSFNKIINLRNGDIEIDERQSDRNERFYITKITLRNIITGPMVTVAQFEPKELLKKQIILQLQGLIKELELE